MVVRFPRFVHGAGPQTNRRRGGRRVGNATRLLHLNGALFFFDALATFPGFETGDVPSSRRRPAAVTRAASNLNGAMFPRADVLIAATVAPAELNRAMFPIRRDGSGRRSSVRVQLDDDPAPRFPPPAHRRCIHLGDRGRGQPVENAPCQARPESPARAASAPVLPRFDHGPSAGAFSTLRPRCRSPTTTEARWAKGGKRNSAPPTEWGDVLRRQPRRTVPGLETGDVPSRRLG